MSRRKLYRIIIEAGAAVLLIFVLVFFLGFRVTSVQVEGNSFYTDDEIKNMVTNVPLAKNSILAGFINTEKSTKDAAMIDSIKISRINRNTLLLQVEEKQIIGYIEYQGQCLNFDRQGIIQIITDEPMENVPKIEGIDVKEAVQGERLSGISRTKLNTILSVGKMLEKMENKPDRLEFNDLNQLVMYYGDIEVRLGDDENMDEKINRLVGILPELEGMSGILHLENTTEDSESVVFDDATQKTEDQQEQETAGENTQEDSSGLEYSDGSDSADTRNRENG
ncbi:MAG TPA: cell division protein FtsQ/DivIB [Candidatus Blautia merdipullorum]|nr:cell division protein FtsQ/DivIB [Candidatus Blautia merdipullorum]